MPSPSRKQFLEPLNLSQTGYRSAPASPGLLTPTPWAGSSSSRPGSPAQSRKQFLEPLNLSQTGHRSAPASPGLLGPTAWPGTSSARPKSPLTPLTPGFSRLLRHARSFANLGSKRNRRADAGPEYQLPPELWFKVFANIPLYQLAAVTLTSRLFCSIAQPLLFTTVSTHPPVGKNSTRKGPQSFKYRQRVADRMEFFFSPRIYSSVVKCILSLQIPEEDDVPPDPLVDGIFDSLSSLPNLKMLECRNIRLTPMRLAVLQKLQLTTLSLEMCFGEISDFACAPSVPLQEVTFKYPDASLNRDKANPCLPFLSPSHLEQLHATTISILPNLAHSPPFRKLRTLDIPVECITSDLFIPALSRCPAVDHLSLHVDSVPFARTNLESLPEGVLPRLTSYHGPHHFAAALLRSRNAQKVEISLPCHPHRLEASLKGIEPSLTSLAFRLEGVELPASLLGTIHHSFPALKSLAVREPALSSVDILTAVRSAPLHRAVEDITFHIQGRDKFNLWIPPEEAIADAISCFKKTLPAFMATYPNLKIVRFRHGSEGGRVIWHRSSLTGTFVQVAAESSGHRPSQWTPA
ncbi:hypothetical protein C8R45DRAFT_978491 [Mycena sanguinolenta]|nr:hypothetical protein C8R45DRAFT_978491 [Mycena sanguinolenta]